MYEYEIQRYRSADLVRRGAEARLAREAVLARRAARRAARRTGRRTGRHDASGTESHTPHHRRHRSARAA
ncbi:hypothetical protein KVH24_24985 [Streptomyces olivaceus]|uniref:hypothetical protein n=1 Tax=Streptomyces olivaceus TaxID=47716 RepID=UPI001CCE901C|nr:hypothetical protein [Streptomyces olivaceus]MBZ6175788.1 hypothetical protein [Streptomyces olivaceus]MBZ6182230.1 hypothetical protein [Streptomyces olivaceus]